jgi:hypothetical protein
MSTEIRNLAKDIQDRVRELAYLMWDSAGRQHGMAMEYWLAAEREVLSTMQAAAERMMPGEPKAETKQEAAPAAQSAATPPEEKTVVPDTARAAATEMPKTTAKAAPRKTTTARAKERP